VLTLEPLKQRLAEQQVEAGGLERLLIADSAIENFAEQASAGRSEPTAIADAVYAALRARAKSLAFVPWSLGELRPTPVLTAAQTLPKLKAGARAELYPLELTALAVAALRSQDVPARVAELIDVKGRSAPLDPSGYLGYFAVALPVEKGVRLYDVYGGQSVEGAPHKLLSDTEAVGAALALRALHENTYLADPQKALGTSSHALRLAGSLPSVRTVRGVVVLTEKMVEQGLAELQAARELRGDAPRLHNLASVMLMTGELDKAQSVLSGALEKAPDFAGARATLAGLLMLQGQSEQAYAELQKAERLAPQLTLVQWGLADYELRSSDREQALERARRAYARAPSFDAKLRLAALLRQAAKYEEMRTLAAELLAQAPAYRREDVRGLLNSLLGPSALDADQPSADTARDDLSNLGGADLKLQAPAPAELGLGQKSPKLRLSEPGADLKLRLGGK
jgi:tetratricopeptide (TPR) repeat protein